ncbi:alkaline phosphatase-like protein [Hesseltinella vesiculosa]|uniref:Alkaline phosphatase-like protein n=1 Tax=Hesseltinella vesiculosa TaxID=101127 RepID=A0A1X2G663_9FUNG|nr:alkaline phosphatase-like protein [Hesseltinella vesiculosa]
MALRSTLLALTCLHLIGLALFLKGFLLTRQTLGHHGTFYDPWERFPWSPDAAHHPTDNAAQDTVVFPRVILVVVDALRFDFMIQDATKDQYYRNRLPIIDHLRTTQPDNTLLYQFQADPPTTTMQRIKGLMTGSLPTFIDAGANFASTAVEEDHLLVHLARKYPSVHFMGDDTWEHLFAASLISNQTFASDSFRMFDLHTVDNRIQEHLWPLLDSPDFASSPVPQLVIAHFLGVDHCGHTYGPSHPNMALKLNDMNTILERIVSHVDKDTLLIVIGDHGMSTEGDHGGESIEELMSGLLLYSGQPLRMTSTPDDHTSAFLHQLVARVYQQRRQILDIDLDAISGRLHYNASAVPLVPQIQLVPTLAYLLGIPAPFGNLGALIPDVLLRGPIDNVHDRLLHMVLQFRMNALQVYDYLSAYGQHGSHAGFSVESLSPLLDQLAAADAWLESASLPDPSGDRLELLSQALLSYDAFLANTIKYCQAIWAHFDIGCMLLGIALLGIALLTSLYLWTQSFLAMSNPLASYRRDLVLLAVFLSVCIALGERRLSWWHGAFEKMTWIDDILTCVFLCICAWLASSSKMVQPSSKAPLQWIDGCVLLVLCIVQAFTLGSNSFVVWEDRGTLYSAATLATWWAILRLRHVCRHMQQPLSASVALRAVASPMILLVFLRWSSSFGQCREEQLQHCTYWNLPQAPMPIDNVRDNALVLGSVLALAFFFLLALTKLVSWISDHTRPMPGHALFMILYVFALGAAVARSLDQLCQMTFAFDEQGGSLFTWPWLLDIYLPRAVYLVCTGGSLCWGTLAKRCSSPKSCLASWLGVFCFWSVTLALLQQPIGTLLLLLSPPLLYLLVDHHYGNDAFLRLALAHLLGHHLFYTTGHQAMFSSLPWKAAFIGFDDMYYYVGAVLVSLSTLSGYLMAWLTCWLIIQDQATSDHLAPVSTSSSLFLGLLQSIPTFLSSIFVFVLRRHLMTWKIFAPRFLLQVLLVAGTWLCHSLSPL